MSKRNHNNRQVNNSQKVVLAPLTKIDIIIPVYGAFDFLEDCLKHISESASDVSYRLYILDNASPDKEKADEVFARIKTEYAPHLDRIYRAKENLGFPNGCNYASRFGKSPYILFLNTDVNLEPNAVKIMYEVMKEDSQNGIVCPKLLFPKDTPSGKAGTIQHAGMDMNIRSDLVHTFIGWSADHPKANVRGEVYACTGACFLIKRDLFQKLQGFFQGYGLGTYEDVDLCLRVKESKYKVFYEPRAVGTHYVAASAREAKQGFPLQQNRELFQMRCRSSFFWSEWTRL